MPQQLQSLAIATKGKKQEEGASDVLDAHPPRLGDRSDSIVEVALLPSSLPEPYVHVVYVSTLVWDHKSMADAPPLYSRAASRG